MDESKIRNISKKFPKATAASAGGIVGYSLAYVVLILGQLIFSRDVCLPSASFWPQLCVLGICLLPSLIAVVIMVVVVDGLRLRGRELWGPSRLPINSFGVAFFFVLAVDIVRSISEISRLNL